MTLANTFTGHLYFVSGLANGREVFLGKAIDEPFQEQLSLEGKTISFTAQGVLIRPFVTMISFPARDPGYAIHKITIPEAIQEATAILSTSISQINRATYPLVFAWIESLGKRDVAHPWSPNGPQRGLAANPFVGFLDGFAISAEQYRRALYQSPQVNTTAELDKLTELEGNLTIEVGKITNQIAIKLNQVVAREAELIRYLDAIQGANTRFALANQGGGWTFLMNRLQIAKNWARRQGKTPLVREVNALIKEVINNLNEIILEHCSALDTLITETFSLYGITFEILGAVSPFTSYTGPIAAAIENYELPATIHAPSFAGSPA